MRDIKRGMVDMVVWAISMVNMMDGDQEAVFLPKNVRVRDSSRAFFSSFDGLGERPCRSEESFFLFFLSSASPLYLGL